MKKLFALYIASVIVFLVTKPAGAQNMPDGSTAPAYYANPIMLNPFVTPASVNFIRNWKPAVPVTDTTSWGLNAPANYKVTTSYLSGLGQSLQTNSRGTNSPDVVTISINKPSLTHIGFLPFTAPVQSHFLINPYGTEQTYYNQNYPDETGASYSENITEYYNNVLTERSFSAGASFAGQKAGHTVKTIYNDTDQILVLNDGPDFPHIDGFYSAGRLTVKIITDSTPDHRQESSAREYYDRDSRMVCKRVSYAKDNSGKDIWLSTYYVYNDFGRITYIIPPKVNVQLNTNMFIVMQDGYCYHYIYDDFGNLIQKLVPNKTGYESTVYDRKHRPVLYQSPLMVSRHQWHFNIYDSRGRIRMSGITTINHSQADWTSLLDVPTATQDGSLIDYLVNEFNDNYPANNIISGCDVQVLNYYDRYDYDDMINHPFANDHIPYYMTGVGTVTPEPYMLAQGLLTASKTKVLDNDTANFAGNYVVNVFYYDKKANLIQTQTLNPWNGAIHNDFSNWDIFTSQYNFGGQKIAEMITHHWIATSAKPGTFIQKHYNYDLNNGGRLSSVTQNVDNTAWMNIATYTYDDLGRVSKKNLGNVESQNYSYNIRGQMQGINEDYTVNGTNPNHDITFGCKLGYDFGFSTKRFDGKAAGYFWRGAGQNAPLRAYGYQYDLAGRLGHAEFREFTDPSDPANTNPSWNKVHTDYTASNMVYDDNSNLLYMNQRGVGLVNNTYQPVDIDKLQYYYYHDQLTSVRDYVTVNYHLGDFIDVECQPDPNGPPDQNNPPQFLVMPADSSSYQNPEDTTTVTRNSTDTTTSQNTADSAVQWAANLVFNNPNTYTDPYHGGNEVHPDPPPGCNDYRYDWDGNLIYDLNKGITSISYNHQDLPLQVYIPQGTATNTIKNIYDGSGNLLRKIVHDDVNNTTDSFEYWEGLVYKNSTLQYILHDEGRTRWDATTNHFGYDYFVKDHLGNVRTVVTAEEYDPIIYAATHELAVANLEASIFDNIDEVRSDRPSPGPSDTKAAELYGDDSTKRIGTAMLLKVMAGDKLDIDVSSFFDEDSTYQQAADAPSMLSSLFSALAGGVNPVGGSEGQNAQAIFGSFDPNDFATAYQALLDESTDSTLPTAYLNYLVFDEHFKMMPEYSTVKQISGPPSDWRNLELYNLNTMVNGYTLIFVSNSSLTHVFFDRLRIHFYKGSLAQEQHYYPYGLTINMGQAPGLPNKFLYQGKLLQDDFGLSLYDFHARQYDPQIGRFWGIDPADQFPNGYTGMGSDPANTVDPTGMVATITRSLAYPNPTDGPSNGNEGSYYNRSDRNEVFDGPPSILDDDRFIGAGSGSDWVCDLLGAFSEIGNSSNKLQDAKNATPLDNAAHSSDGCGTGQSYENLWQGGGNVYHDGLYTVKYYQNAFLPIEGAGIRGGYNVDGTIGIAKGPDGNWHANISMGGTTDVSNDGNVDFYGTATLKNNGEVISSQSFSNGDEARMNKTGLIPAGTANFTLPTTGKISIEINVHYIFQTDGGGAVPQNLPPYNTPYIFNVPLIYRATYINQGH